MPNHVYAHVRHATKALMPAIFGALAPGTPLNFLAYTRSQSLASKTKVSHLVRGFLSTSFTSPDSIFSTSAFTSSRNWPEARSIRSLRHASVRFTFAWLRVARLAACATIAPPSVAVVRK